MDLITAEDITDSILVGRVTAANLDVANEAVARLAATYGVEEAAITPSNLLKRYGVVVACRECCLELVGTDPTVQIGSYSGSRQDDIYERKYKLYDALGKDILKDLTMADFTGGENPEKGGNSWTKTVNIYRG